YDVEQAPGGQGHRSRLGDLGLAGAAQAHFEVRRQEFEPVLLRVDDDVREDRNGALLLHDPLHHLQFPEKVFLRGHEIHRSSNDSRNPFSVRANSLSRSRMASILRMAWMTVVWCLPPKEPPIAGSDLSVRRLQRYMATWRGKEMCLELLRDFSSIVLMRK